MEDPELGIPRDSYPALADWIAADPDNETLVFRKFDRLSTRKLLQMQNQLCIMEAALNQLECEISQASYSKPWETFTDEAQDEGCPEWRRVRLGGEIKRKLTEYHEALILQSHIAKLRKPPRRVIKQLRDWFKSRSRGSDYDITASEARNILDDELDLVTLKAPSDSDMLFRLVKRHWPLEACSRNPRTGGKLTLRMKGTNGSRIRDNARYLRLRYVERIVASISTFLAAAETSGAIYGLYFITDQSVRLAMVAVFTFVFGLSLRFLANARRVEIFVASATYGAVLVVFVSKNLGQPG